MSEHDEKACTCNECVIRRWREIEADAKARQAARERALKQSPRGESNE